MKRLITAGIVTALLASAGARLAQTEEPSAQLFATAGEGGPAEDVNIAALLASADALLAQTKDSGAQLFATPQEGGPASAGTHIVARGETLWSLSGKYYGDPFQWGRLYSANLDKVADPDRIYPNEEILVPELAGTVNNVPVTKPGAAGRLSGSEAEIEAGKFSGSETETAAGRFSASESETSSGVEYGGGSGQAAMGSGGLFSPGAGVAPSRNNVSLLSEEIPNDQQEWTGNASKIVPGNWKGDGVIAAKLGDDSDPMAEGLTEPGDSVLIKVGNPAAFRPGDMLAAYMKGAPAYDTKTGRELGVKIQKTGTLEVLSISGNTVKARILSAGTSVDKGQLITQ